MRTITSFCLLFATGFVAGAPEPLDPGEIRSYEKLLSEARIEPNDSGLVRFFESQTPSDEERALWDQLVIDLGDNDFETREYATEKLHQAGWPAIGHLRKAVRSKDPEVVFRARHCIDRIEETPIADMVIAAARLIGHRRSEGGLAVLLRSVDHIDDPHAVEVVLETLKKIGTKDKAVAPLLADAAKSESNRQRIAAALALADAKPEQRKLALPLLKDSALDVRFRAAKSLVRVGERSAMPVLLSLIDEVGRNQVYEIEDILYHLAGIDVNIQSPSEWKPAQRQAYEAQWVAWWKEKSATIDLAQLGRERVMLGLHLISELDGSGKGQGRVWECGRDGKPRWVLDNLQRPIDAQYLPNGHIIVAEHNNRRVSVRDKSGKIHWEYTCKNSPVSVARLRNGNYFIATYNELLEIKPSHQIVTSIQRQGRMMYNAQKLPNGNFILAESGNRVVELDPKGKEVKTIPVQGTSYWSSVEKLRNGRYLVACGSGNKVVEVDDSGKVWWECKMNKAGHAVRLPNGRTLVTSIEGRTIAEYDREGNEVWKQKTAGRPFHAYRR